MGVEGGGPRRSVFLWGQQFFQSRILGIPRGFVRVKGICQTTPTTIFCQYRLFLAVGRIAALCYPLFNSFQGSNRGYVIGVLFFWLARQLRALWGNIVVGLIGTRLGQCLGIRHVLRQTTRIRLRWGGFHVPRSRRFALCYIVRGSQ